jgi:hypothetical protein
MIGFGITVILGTVASLWMPQSEHIQKKLLSPLIYVVLGVSTDSEKETDGDNVEKSNTDDNPGRNESKYANTQM